MLQNRGGRRNLRSVDVVNVVLPKRHLQVEAEVVRGKAELEKRSEARSVRVSKEASKKGIQVCDSNDERGSGDRGRGENALVLHTTVKTTFGGRRLTGFGAKSTAKRQKERAGSSAEYRERKKKKFQ